MDQSRMSEFILSRHAKRARLGIEEEMSKYVGITREGEKEAREKIKKISDIIGNLPQGSVIILGGVSKAVHTRSTLELYTDELQRIFKDKKDVVFSKPFNPITPLGALREISVKMEKTSKAIVQFPLWIKQFATFPKQWEEWEKYFSGLEGMSKENEVAEWIKMKKGPNPNKVAECFIIGMEREEKFFRKFFSENFILFINISHSGELDAVFTYFANKGEVTKEGFEKIGGMVRECEFGRVSFLPQRRIFEYRGKKFSL